MSNKTTGMVKNIIIAVLLIAAIAIPVRYKMAYDNLAKNNKVEKKFVERVLKYKVNTRDTADKGYLLMATGSTDRKNGDLLIMDMTGNLLYHKTFPAAIWDFRQWKFGDKIFYTYGITDSTSYHPKEVASFAIGGYYVLLDSALNEIGKIELAKGDNIDFSKKPNLDVHDLLLLSDKHYIAYTGYEKEVNNIPGELKPAAKKKVIACILQEVDNGKVIWQWDASDFPEFYTSSLEDNNFKNDTPCDYIHNNTVTLDTRDSNVIISMRNMNQIVKIERHTGKVLWRLGGKNSDFPMLPEYAFYGQHAVKFMDDHETLQFVDNGHKEKRPYSRILEIKLDEKNKKIANFKQYTVPHTFISQRGNVVNVGGNYLICGGLADYLLLVDPKTNKYLFELKTNMPMYRVFYTNNIYGLEKQNRVAVK